MFQPARIPFLLFQTLGQRKSGLVAEGSPSAATKAVPAMPGRQVKLVSRLPLTVPGGLPIPPSVDER